MNEETTRPLARILSDAKLVAAYGQRAGRLQDSDLVLAIAGVESMAAPRWDSKEVVTLEVALNRAIQIIAPVTLFDLKSGWDPFQRQSQGWVSRDSLSTFAFACLSLLMMVVAAYYTQLYSRGGVLLTALKQIEDARPGEKVGQVVRSLLGAQQLIQRSFASGEYQLVNETYFRLLDELHELDSRMSLYVPMSYDFISEVAHPLHTLQLSLVPPASVYTPPDISGQPAPPNAAALNQQGWCIEEANVPDSAQPIGENNDKFITTLEIFLRDNSRRIAKFVCMEDIHFHPKVLPPISFLITTINDYLRLIGLWVLPSLYGAIGAMIFHMRVVLNPLLPTPSVVRIVHRVALGGFAGIIIAWFWAPVSQKVPEFSSIGFNLFGMAFLIGFSIDVFFAFLDRAVSVIVGGINRFGRTDKTGSPGAV